MYILITASKGSYKEQIGCMVQFKNSTYIILKKSIDFVIAFRQ